MIDRCAPHRPYLAALADGEMDLVPEATREHVGDCEECMAEIADHGLLGEKLRAALLPATHRGERAPRGLRRRMGVALGIAATLVAAMVGSVVGWRATHGGSDLMGEAVAASQRPPVLHSMDPAAIGLWCAQSSDRRPPPIGIPRMSPIGARMDTVGNTNVVTVFYRDPARTVVAVGWLDAESAPLSRSSAEARSISGTTVIVIHTPAGTAVLSGAPTGELWTSAAALESLTG